MTAIMVGEISGNLRGTSELEALMGSLSGGNVAREHAFISILGNYYKYFSSQAPPAEYLVQK